MTKDNMPDRCGRRVPWQCSLIIDAKAYSAYSGIDCNSVHDLATSTDIDFRISLPNRVHSHRHPRMRSARNLLRQRARINSSIKNYAVVVVFSKEKTRIVALNLVLRWSQAVRRKMIVGVKCFLKTKTTPHFKHLCSNFTACVWHNF